MKHINLIQLEKLYHLKSTHEAESNPCLKFVEGDLLLQNVKPLELEPPKCEGKKKTECKERNEINQCIKKILK